MVNDDIASRIVLTPMAPGRDDEFAEMLAEYRMAGEFHVYSGGFAIAWEGYASFYAVLSRLKLDSTSPSEVVSSDIVTMDSYFIETDGRILGDIYVRHRLMAHLEKSGGHVGYRVRPSYRNRGVASAALHLALARLAAIGVERALITCDTTNAASARVIEKCGGMRIEDAQLADRIERRYWVPTSHQQVMAYSAPG